MLTFKLTPDFHKQDRMMKRIAFVLMLTGLSICAYAQDSPQNSPEFKRNKLIFELASNFNDPSVARMALYNMIVIDSKNPALIDSLALLYYEYQNYASAAIVSQEALRRNPNNPLLLELSALCYENLGLPERALNQYESLYLKQNNPITLYKIAFLQLQLNRFVEANTSADILLSKPELKQQVVVFPKSDNTTQQVSMHAAVYNLKGLVAKEQGNTEEAKSLFNKALEINPDFELALGNVQELVSK